MPKTLEMALLSMVDLEMSICVWFVDAGSDADVLGLVDGGGGGQPPLPIVLPSSGSTSH